MVETTETLTPEERAEALLGAMIAAQRHFGRLGKVPVSFVARLLSGLDLRSTSRDSEVREAIEALRVGHLSRKPGIRQSAWNRAIAAALAILDTHSSEAAPTPDKHVHEGEWCARCVRHGWYQGVGAVGEIEREDRAASEAAPVVGLPSVDDLEAAINAVVNAPDSGVWIDYSGKAKAPGRKARSTPAARRKFARAIIARLTQTRTLGETS